MKQETTVSLGLTTLAKQQKVLEKAAVAWEDQNHPELNTQEDMDKYLRETHVIIT